MIGRQFMGKINSRLQQAKQGQNTAQELLGGVSLIGIGDVAQCEAINDQQLYDLTQHKDVNNPDAKIKLIFHTTV